MELSIRVKGNVYGLSYDVQKCLVFYDEICNN